MDLGSKNKVKTKSKEQKAKNEIFSKLTGVRRSSVRTGAGTHCAQRRSAYKYALCETQRLRTAGKAKKNKKLN